MKDKPFGVMLSSIPLICSVFLAGVFFLLCALHIAWLFRAQRSATSAVIPSIAGTPIFNPGVWATLAVAALLAAAGCVCLWRVGLLPWGFPTVPRVGVWVIAVVFLGRAVGDFKYLGFFKRVRDTKFARWDTYLYSPLCAVIALVAAVLGALGS